MHAGIVFYCINIFKLIGAVELLVPFLTFQQAHDQLKDQDGSFFLSRYCPSMMHIIIPTESTRAPITTPMTPPITPATTTADRSGENEMKSTVIIC